MLNGKLERCLHLEHLHGLAVLTHDKKILSVTENLHTNKKKRNDNKKQYDEYHDTCGGVPLANAHLDACIERMKQDGQDCSQNKYRNKRLVDKKCQHCDCKKENSE